MRDYQHNLRAQDLHAVEAVCGYIYPYAFLSGGR